MGRFLLLPTMPLVSLVTTITVVVVVLVGVPRCAHGQALIHFDIKADIAKKTASKLMPPASDMAARAAEQQAALQVGRCSSLWEKQWSTQCPPGSFMAMKERSTREGLMAASIFRCQAAGCLHATLETGEEEEEDDDAPRDKGATLKAAVTREVHKLVEEQPGTSFDEHLTTLGKRYVEEGLEVKTILKTLLKEASPDRRESTSSSCTTMRFFAELARYRGYVGPEIDQAWAYLHEVHKKEMALAFFRRAPQLLIGWLGRMVVTVGLEANAKAQTIRNQNETVSNLQTELTAALDRERMAEEEAAAAAAAAATPVSGLFAVPESEQIAHEKNATLVSELFQVEQLLAEERDAKETAVVAVEEEAARAKVATVRAKAKAAQLAAVKKLISLHASEVLAALARERAVVKKAAGLEGELSEVKKLLDKQRAETVAVRGEAKAAQLAAEKKASLHASEVSAALAEKRAAAKKAADLTSELSEVEQLLDKQRAETVAVRGEAKADQLVAENKASLHASEVSAALARERAATNKAADLTSEVFHVKQQLDKQRAETVAVRGEAIAAQLAAKKKSSLHASEISSALAGERAAAKKAAELTSELFRVKQLLAEELSASAKAKEKAAEAEEAARAEAVAVHIEAKVAQLAADKIALELSEANALLLGKEGNAKEKCDEDTDLFVAMALFEVQEREGAALAKAAGLESELSLAKKALDKERNATAKAVLAEVAARAELSALRVETRAAQQAAEERTTLLEPELCEGMEREDDDLDKKVVCLASELAQAKKLLAEERSVMEMALTVEHELRAEISALRRKTGDSQQTTAEKNTTVLESELCADTERQKVIHEEKEARLVSELSLFKQLLEEERGVMEMVLVVDDEMRAEISTLRREAGEARQAAAVNTARLESRLSAALVRELVATEKVADLKAGLSLANQLLDKEHGAGKIRL